MAGQRWSESAGHAGRRAGRALVVGGLLLALTGCVTERDPLGAVNGPGIGGANVSNNGLVGEWEVTLLITAGGDTQTWTTVWVFERDGACIYHQEIHSVLEDVTRTKTRLCTWATSGSNLIITYTETGLSESMEFSFPGFDGDRLILQDIEYQRIR